MGGSVVAGHVTGAARLGRVVKVVVIVWLLPKGRAGRFPGWRFFSIGEVVVFVKWERGLMSLRVLTV